MINTIEILRFHLLPIDLEYGDVFWGIYPTDATFPVRQIVTGLANAVSGYRQICINATSMGALIACDLIDELRRRGYKGEIKASLVHPCTRRGLRIVPWRLATKPLLETGVEGSQLYARHKEYMASQTLKRSFWPQLRYILGHRPPHPGQYADITAIVVEPTARDPLLSWYAAWPFLAAFAARTYPVDGVGHSDFVEQPERWKGVFRALYALHYPSG
jgi:hypothetical protein